MKPSDLKLLLTQKELREQEMLLNKAEANLILGSLTLDYVGVVELKKEIHARRKSIVKLRKKATT